jgi:predicted porin
VFYKPTEKLKLTLGSFNTHVGYELNEPTNSNYSLSYLFTNGPYFHTGAKAEYAFSSEFSGMIGVFDDNDSKTDAVKGKHVGAQLAYQKGKIKAFLNFLRGRDLDSLTGQQFDLVVNYQLTPKIALGLNASQKQLTTQKQAEIVVSENKSWSGAAIYATYSANERLSISARHEYFADPNAFFYNISDLKINATTLSLNYKVNDLTLIPELRFDGANSNLFGVEKDKKSAISLLFATVYKF